jgi:hypothetical protein
VTEEEKLGSKAYLESLVQPPLLLRTQKPGSSWEFVLPSEIESSFGVSVRPSTTRAKKRDSTTKVTIGDGTPIKSLKYLIQTPPKAKTPNQSLVSSCDSGASAPAALHGHGSIERGVYAKDELYRWPKLEDFLVTLPEWSVCAICSEMFDEPVQWPACDHTFCKACVTRIMTYGHRECPLCRGGVPNDFGFEDLQPSQRMVSAMLLLPVRCRWGLCSKTRRSSSSSDLGSTTMDSSSEATTSGQASSFGQLSFGPLSGSIGSIGSERSGSVSSLEAYMRDYPESPWTPREDGYGCEEIFPLASLSSHLETCPFAPVICLFTGCRKTFPRSEIEAHQEECPHKPVDCPHCKSSQPTALLSAHLRSCPEVSIECVCGQRMARKEMREHTFTECPEAPLACPFAKHGCQHQGPRGDLSVHLKGCPYEAIKGFIERTESRFEEYDRTIEKLESMVLSLRSALHQQTSRHTSRPSRASIGTSSHASSCHLFPSSTLAQSISQHSASGLFQQSQGGQVGHGPRKGRFWDDDNFDIDSDDEFSIYL